MASNSDGRITIDTGIDNTGFERGSKKLTDSLQSLKGSINSIGETLSRGLDSTMGSILQSFKINSTNSYQAVHTSAEALAEANEGIADSAQDADTATQAMANNGVPQKLMSEYNSINNTATSLSNQLQRLSTTAEQGFKTEGQVARFRDSVDVVSQKVEALRNRLDSVGQTKVPTEEYKQLQNEVAKVTNTLDRLRTRQELLDSTGASTSTQAYKRLETQIENCKTALQYMQAEMQSMEASGEAYIGGAMTSQYQNLADKLSGVEAKLSAVQDAGEDAASAVGDVGSKNPLVSALSTAAQKAANAFQSMGKAILRTGISAFQTAVKKLASSLSSVASNAKSAVSSLFSLGSSASSSTLSVEALTRSLTSLKTMLLSQLKRTFMSDIMSDTSEAMQQFALYNQAFNRSMSNIKNTGTQISANIAVLMSNIIRVVEPVLIRILNLINSVITAVNALFSLITGKKSVSVAVKPTASYAEASEKVSKAKKKEAKETKKATEEQKKYNAELYSWDELTRQAARDADKAIDPIDNDLDIDDPDDGGGGGGGLSWEEIPIDDILPEWLKKWFQELMDLIDKEDWEGVGRHIADAINKGLKILDDWINTTFRPWAVKWASNLARILNGVVEGLDWKLLGKTFSDGLAAIFDAGATFLETFKFDKLGRGLGQALNAIFENKDMWQQAARFFAAKFNAMINLAWGFIQETLPNAFNWGATIAGFIMDTLSRIEWRKLADVIVDGINWICEFIEGFLSDESRWDAILARIQSAFSYVVNNVDMARLGQDISNLLIRILDFMAGLDWESFGRQIGEFLANIDWAGILERVALILLEAFKGFVEGLFSTSNGRVFVLLVAGLKLLPLAFTLTAGLLKLAAMKWVLAGTGPLEAMPGTIGTIGGSILSALKTLAAGIGTAALAVGDALLVAYDVQKLKQASDTYKQAQEAHNNETQTALDNFKKIYETKGPEVAAEWAKTCYDIDTTGMSLEEGQQALTEKIETLWDDVPQNMWEGFKQGWNSYFGEGGSGLIGLLGDAFTSALEGIRAILGINSPSTVFMEIGQFLVEGLFQGISQTWLQITTFFATAIPELITTVATGWSELLTNTQATWESIKTATSTAWEAVKTHVTTAVTNMKTHIVTAWTNLKTNTQTTWTNIKTNIQTSMTQAKTSAVTATNGMKASIIAHWTTMVTNARTKFQQVLTTCKTNMNAAQNHIKSMQWGPIGSNLVHGLLRGLQSAWSSVMSWARSAASALTSTLRSAFSIHSPSRVWAEIGMLLDAGLVQGLQNGSAKIFRSVADLAAGVSDRMDDMSASLSFTDDADVTRLDAVMAKLSQIAVIIDNIGHALVEMGGLQIPQIAEGTVVPYRTAAAAESSTSEGYTNETENEVLQLLRNIVDYLQQGGQSGDRDIKIMIDGQEIFNVVVDENNRAIQSTGGVSPLRV